MDPLSDVLHAVRLTAGIFFTARLAAPWAFRTPPPDSLAPALGIRADSIALFHILVEGRCWLEIEGLPPREVEGGTLIVLPHGHAHVVTSRLDLEPRPLDVLLEQCGSEGIPRVSHGRGDEACRFLCGYLACDQRFNPLIGALPTLLLASPEQGTLVAEPSEGDPQAPRGGQKDAGHWLEEALRRTIEEASGKRPGSPAMVARLTELLYLELLRQYAERLPVGSTGWLAGVRHPEVGRALRRLHAEPARKWTVSTLAREVHLSRSALGQRFREVVGTSPMRYLAEWRMQLAQHHLRQDELGIAQVAARVGYASEAAFLRAFKRLVGRTPSEWRRALRAPP